MGFRIFRASVLETCYRNFSRIRDMNLLRVQKRELRIHTRNMQLHVNFTGVTINASSGLCFGDFNPDGLHMNKNKQKLIAGFYRTHKSIFLRIEPIPDLVSGKEEKRE